MEYKFFVESKYLFSGRLETRVLTAEQAEALGYEDGYVDQSEDGKIYVDGFDTMEGAQHYLDSLVDNNVVE